MDGLYTLKIVKIVWNLISKMLVVFEKGHIYFFWGGILIICSRDYNIEYEEKEEEAELHVRRK